jgi:hypothetical protein
LPPLEVQQTLHGFKILNGVPNELTPEIPEKKKARRR